MPAPKDYPWGEVRMAVISGFMTQEKAAKAYNIPLGTIAAACARDDWFGRKAAAKKAEEEAAAAALLPPPEPGKPAYKKYEHTEADSLRIAQETAASMKDEIRDLGARVARKGLKALAQDEVTGAAVVAASKNLKDLVDVGAKVCGFDTPENATILSLNFLGDDMEPKRVSVREEPLIAIP